jgi:choline dehydrogenase-like flavoprotein
VDASFLPSSTAVNPSVTIVAQAVRTADHLLKNTVKVGDASHDRH